MAATNYISKGVHCFINAHGSGFIAGGSYTACLYYSAKEQDYRATVTTIAQTVDDRVVCIFDFTDEQTKKLKKGDVILEIYDTVNKEQMKFIEPFATVRTSSLSE